MEDAGRVKIKVLVNATLERGVAGCNTQQDSDPRGCLFLLALSRRPNCGGGRGGIIIFFAVAHEFLEVLIKLFAVGPVVNHERRCEEHVNALVDILGDTLENTPAGTL